MRALILLALFFAACGPASLLKPCSGDASCGQGLVCSSLTGAPGPACTYACSPTGQEPDVSFCKNTLGPDFSCHKYTGPDSGGYACGK